MSRKIQSLQSTWSETRTGSRGSMANDEGDRRVRPSGSGVPCRTSTGTHMASATNIPIRSQGARRRQPYSQRCKIETGLRSIKKTWAACSNTSQAADAAFRAALQPVEDRRILPCRPARAGIFMMFVGYIIESFTDDRGKHRGRGGEKPTLGSTDMGIRPALPGGFGAAAAAAAPGFFV